MEITVTGSGGFIGTPLVELLRQRGHIVNEFDRANGKDLLNRADPIQGDHVIHLAGVLGTAELFDSPETAVDVNVKGSLRVLQECRYHKMGYTGITMPKVFPSIYTATKIASTALATAYHQAFDLPVSHVRAYNAFGAGQKHGPGHPRKIIPSFATEAWNNEPITIWGSGEQTVDLISVTQLARMLADAVDFANDETFDGGSGKAFSVNEVANMVLDITGSTAGIRHLPMRLGEVETNIVATGESWELLDWVPDFFYDELEAAVLSYKP